MLLVVLSMAAFGLISHVAHRKYFAHFSPRCIWSGGFAAGQLSVAIAASIYWLLS